MNLYRIMFRHHSHLNSQTGTICLILAETDKEVYEFIKLEKQINDEHVFVSWEDSELKEEDRDIYDDDYLIIGKETWKEHIIRIKGEMFDDDYYYSDLYYGVTVVGWELLKEDTKTDYSELIELGQVFVASNHLTT